MVRLRFQECMKQELKGARNLGKTAWHNAFKKAAKKCAKKYAKIVPGGPRTREGLKEVRRAIARERAALDLKEKKAIKYYRLHHLK